MKFNGWTALSLVILLAGLAFWAYMGTTYNNWSDVGVYSVGVTLVGFGVIGAIVSLLRKQPAA